MKTVVVRYFCDEEESNEKFCYTVRLFCAAVAASMTTNEFSHTLHFRISLSLPPLGAFPQCFSCIQPSICFCSWIRCRPLSALPKNFCVEPTILLISNACSSFNFKTHTSSSLSIEYSQGRRKFHWTLDFIPFSPPLSSLFDAQTHGSMHTID